MSNVDPSTAEPLTQFEWMAWRIDPSQGGARKPAAYRVSAPPQLRSSKSRRSSTATKDQNFNTIASRRRRETVCWALHCELVHDKGYEMRPPGFGSTKSTILQSSHDYVGVHDKLGVGKTSHVHGQIFESVLESLRRTAATNVLVKDNVRENSGLGQLGCR